MTTMKAVRAHKYGGPDVLRHEEAAHSTIGKEEILIKVQAAAVNSQPGR